MTDDRVWVVAARIATTAEPDDPHARFELMQAIVDFVQERAGMQKKTIDKYGLALMMISHGTVDPKRVAAKALAKRWACKCCGWHGEMPNTKVLPDSMGTAQTPSCPDCDQHAALSREPIGPVGGAKEP